MTAGQTADAWLLSCGHETSGPSSAGDSVDCQACDHRSIPALVTTGRRTNTFGAETVPGGLLRDHRTTTWARLEVEAGTVTFVEEEPHWTTSIAGGGTLVIVPDRAHRIELSADARFSIQFFDLPEQLNVGARSPADVPPCDAEEDAGKGAGR